MAITVPSPSEISLVPSPAARPDGAVPAATAVGLTKTYGKGDAIVRALDNVNVAFERGRFSAVMGPLRVWEVHAHALHGRP
jgi:hypothetical protein